ncbi:AbrB/MazE/SpoVT family DNA-binding domain-containing protein [Desulfosporosinus sp. FKB]|uniref:AbrB/MazE/SpoVT family DNA-binding domain-containing protein n=1 Tax=Desulfosporosinus sp. FKB TaxID=1969835 RepID=UPI000B4A3F14|nr:AbrB/MazE/SpoVT family DNA-binding domain-containing protein [Desulfosporosinus sp. FKB]
MAKQLLSGKLTSKGQMTIPVELRTLLKLNEGDRLVFILDEKEGIIEVQPKTKKSVRGATGTLGHPWPSDVRRRHSAMNGAYGGNPAPQSKSLERLVCSASYALSEA